MAMIATLRHKGIGLLLVVACTVYRSFPSLVVVTGDLWISPKEEASQKRKLIVLHYHKTGHDLSAVLAMAGFHRHFQRYKSPKKRLPHVIADQQNDSDVALVDGVELFQPWEDWMLPTTRLAHFVRDPFDWCLSAYLYHRQVPIPTLEQRWMNKTDKERCRIRDQDFAATAFNVDLTPIADLCQSLSNESALHPQLQILSFEDGIRLEASRGLLGSRHGDLMRMAHHVWLSRDAGANVQTYLLSQFTSSPSSFHQASRRLCHFYGGRHVVDCVRDSMEHAYLNANKSGNNEHVTAHHLSRDEKQNYKAMLRSDPVLGPPLIKIQALIQEAWKKDWPESTSQQWMLDAKTRQG